MSSNQPRSDDDDGGSSSGISGIDPVPAFKAQDLSNLLLSATTSSFRSRLAGLNANGRTLSTSKNKSSIFESGASAGSTVAGNREEFRSNINVQKRRGTPISTSFHSTGVETPRSSGSVTPRNTSRTPGANTTPAGPEPNPNCLVAVLEGRGSARGEVGLACISLHNPTLILCQFSDTRTYVRTLTKLSVFNPSEILIPNSNLESTSPNAKLYEDIQERCPRASVTHIHRKYFNESRGLQTVKHLCAPEYSSVELQLHHKYYALAASCALLKYVEYIQNVIYAPKSLRVEFQASAQSTMIDYETARHIELLAPSFNPKANHSLFGFLNHCSTPGGVRYLRANLFQPPVELPVIRSRQEVITELVENPALMHQLQSVLNRFCDIDQLLSLCVVLPKQDTLAVVEQRINHVIGLKHSLDLIVPLHSALEGSQSGFFLEIRTVLEDPKYAELLEKVKVVIHDEAKMKKGSAAMKLQRCFAVRGGVNGLLDVARRTYCEIVDDIEEMVRQLSEEHGMPFRIGYNALRGYHVQINTNSKSKKGPPVNIKDLPEHFIQPQQWKNVISFTTEEIVQADQKSQEALREITLMSNVIVQELLSEIRGVIGCLYKLSECISTLDMLVAFAQISGMHGFVKPEFSDDSLTIKQGRHPILENIGCMTVIPNDTFASEDSNFIVLTGANMAGKSTYLRQVILLQIMAQVGCYVPADYACFRVADSIFSRIGTGDSIECNASSFMLEMKEMAYILGSLGPRSLVIMDELGRATEPDAGSALCWAIAEHLMKKSAFSFLATHFPLLTRLDKLYGNVVNYHFLTELATASESSTSTGLLQTHRLARGDVEMKNYGLQLARATALPESVIKEAETMAAELVSGQKVVPDACPQDIEVMNAQRLCRCVLRAYKSNKENLKEVCKQLQEWFVETDEVATVSASEE